MTTTYKKYVLLYTENARVYTDDFIDEEVLRVKAKELGYELNELSNGLRIDKEDGNSLLLYIFDENDIFVNNDIVPEQLRFIDVKDETNKYLYNFVKHKVYRYNTNTKNMIELILDDRNRYRIQGKRLRENDILEEYLGSLYKRGTFLK